jgi:hypothetical protein
MDTTRSSQYGSDVPPKSAAFRSLASITEGCVRECECVACQDRVAAGETNLSS